MNSSYARFIVRERLLLLLLTALWGLSCSRQPHERVPYPQSEWVRLGEGQLEDYWNTYWTQKDYPGYGMVGYLIDEPPRRLSPERKRLHLQTSLQLCRQTFAEAYALGDLRPPVEYVVVLVQNARDHSEYGAVYSASDVLGSNKPLADTVAREPIEEHPSITRSVLDPERGGYFERNSLPFIERHMAQRAKGEQVRLPAANAIKEPNADQRAGE